MLQSYVTIKTAEAFSEEWEVGNNGTELTAGEMSLLALATTLPGKRGFFS